MRNLTPLANLETGVMFWAGRNPDDTLAELAGLGIRCGQLGFPGNLDLESAAVWKDAIRRAGFVIYTAIASFNGEDYADIPTVKDTVGFIPPRFRDERVARMLQVSDVAASLGIPGIGMHVGMVPEDTTDPDYIAVREVTRRIADHAASHGQTVSLETGQETAEHLLAFLIDVNRANVGINFDPANMILYGTGDPIEALGILGAHVLSVHAKDGDWPPAGQPDALGTERPLGSGAVGIERFVRKLVQVGYKGPLAIEREVPDHATRMRDIATAIRVLDEAKRAVLVS
jgi:sugar phosphate isomerase/epimerase